jgi:hypothetical protein
MAKRHTGYTQFKHITKRNTNAFDFLNEQVMLDHATNAPLVLHPEWADSYKEFAPKAAEERIAKVKRGDLSKEATDFEALLYLSTVSLVTPINTDDHDLMMYLFRKTNGNEAADRLDFPKVNLEANPSLKDALTKLKKWIYATQEKHLAEKKKEGKKIHKIKG